MSPPPTMCLGPPPCILVPHHVSWPPTMCLRLSPHLHVPIPTNTHQPPPMHSALLPCAPAPTCTGDGKRGNGNPLPPQVVLLVSLSTNTNQWLQIQIPNMQDLLVVQFMGNFSSLTIYNVYNDCHNSDSINWLQEHLLWQDYNAAGPLYSMWCGDFNWHHPM